MRQSTINPARDEKESESVVFYPASGITKNIRGRLIATNDNAGERYYDTPRELVHREKHRGSFEHTHTHTECPSYCLTRSYLATETSLDASR